MNKTHYKVTIGYTAVVTVDLNAENEQQAIELARTEFDKVRSAANRNKLTLDDDNVVIAGVLDMDESWNKL